MMPPELFQQLRQRLAEDADHANRIRHWRVIVMALSAFIFNTTEFVPIALLSDIGNSFDMPVNDVGMMITIYAWLVALLSLPAMLATAHWPRKKLLLGIFAVFVAGHAVSVLAARFEMLLVGRALIALAHAVFWSITASLVVRVAPSGGETKALGLLSMGSALATVLGLPLGRLIGQWLGWRMTFAVIGVAAMVAMLIVWRILPRLVSRDVGSLASLPQIGRNVPLLVVYALTMTCVTAHFTAYSYIEPSMLMLNRFSPNFATGLLLVFGVAGLVASWLFGQYYERQPRLFLTLAMVALVVALCGAWQLSSGWLGNQVGWVGLTLVWGLAITAITLALQIRVLQLAPKATDVAMAIFSGIYNVGIGGGALIGAVVIGSAAGLQAVGLVGMGIGLVALSIWALFLWLLTRVQVQVR